MPTVQLRATLYAVTGGAWRPVEDWHSQRVGKNEFVLFKEKLKNRSGRAKLGFLICTGTFADTADIEKLRTSQDDTLVVLIDGADLRELVRSRNRGDTLHGLYLKALSR
jgi:hypothetical protein